MVRQRMKKSFYLIYKKALLKKSFYSIYKKVGNDIRPLATFDSRQEVADYLGVTKNRVSHKIKLSKNWSTDNSSNILVFKDVI